MDLAAQAAVDGDGGHALHALEARREDVLGQFTQLYAVEGAVRALEREAHDRRRVRVELLDDRRVGILGQATADAVDTGADVVQRLIEVGAPGEVQLDARAAFLRVRIHLVEP